MASLVAMPSHPEVGAAAYEEIASRRGGGDVRTLDLWEERHYIMKFSDYTWTSIDAENASGVPAYGAQLGSFNCYLMEKSVQADAGDQSVVHVTVTFRSLKPTEKQPHFNATQSRWSIVKTMDWQPWESKIDKDVTGKPCVNVLGEPIQPPLMVYKADAKIHIKFLTNASDAQWAIGQCMLSVNSKAYTITIGACPYFCDIGTLFCMPGSVSDAWDENGSRATDIQMDLLYRAPDLSNSTASGSAWWEFRPNLSLCVATYASAPTYAALPIMKGTDGTYTTNNTNGVYINDPLYLNSSGQILTAGSAIVLNSFVVKGTANFDTLLSGLLA
jgi:hypothetical protein